MIRQWPAKHKVMQKINSFLLSTNWNITDNVTLYEFKEIYCEALKKNTTAWHVHMIGVMVPTDIIIALKHS